MTVKTKPAKFLVFLNIHDYSYKHAYTSCGDKSWAEIKKYIEFLSTKVIPDDSCVYDLEVDAHEIRSLGFNAERGGAPLPRESHRQPQARIHINITNSKNCGTAHCLENIAAGKCKDAYIIETIGKKFFADKYAKKVK